MEEASTGVTECDVLVLGTGAAGCAVATRLSMAGWQVVLAGAEVADSPPSLQWLSAAGEERLTRLRCPPTLSVETTPGFLGIWGEAGAGDPLADHPAADRRVVDGADLVTALRLQARAAGVRLTIGSATRVQQRDNGWRIQFRRPRGGWRTVQSRFAVDASGRDAVVASALRVPRSNSDTLVAWRWALARPADQEPLMTLIEAAPHGWWRSIDLASGRREVTFFSDHDLQAHQGADWDSVLALAAHAPATLQRMLECNPPELIHPYPAGCSALREAGGRGWLAVGEAAATFDPIGAGGLDFALVCADVACGAIAQALSGEPDAPLRFNQLVRGACAAHALERQARYNAETRWTAEPFWQRRRMSPQAAAEVAVVPPSTRAGFAVAA